MIAIAEPMTSASGPGLEAEKLAYIEEMGIAIEGLGLPRMAGRVLGALLIADPPEQSAEDLAETLQASRGSISTTTRLLEMPGLIERVSKPGDRRVYYRNRPDAWYQATRREAAALGQMRELADKALDLLEGAPDEVRQGAEDMREFYAFWEREMPAVLDHWHRHTRRRRDDEEA